MNDANSGLLDIPAHVLRTWQGIVDLLAEIIGVSATLIMRLEDPDISVLVKNRTANNPFQVGQKQPLWGSGLYCEEVLTSRKMLLVPNALKDPKWEHGPGVNINMISYLGLPILLPNGKLFGTICILDDKENAYSEAYTKLLGLFRNIIESDLEVLHMNHVLGDENRRLSDYLTEIQALRDLIPICANCKSIRDAQNNWHPIEHYLLKNPKADFTHGICPECMKKLYPEKAQ